MAVAYDNSNSVDSGVASTMTMASFACAGSDRLLVVGVAIESGSTDVVSVVRGGSETFTQFAHADSNEDASLWYFKNPATTAADIVVTLTKSKSSASFAISFNGVDQTTPVASAQTQTGTGTSASVTVTAASGDMVVDCLGEVDSGSAPTIGADQTLRESVLSTGGTNNIYLRGSTQPYISGSEVMSWSWTGSADFAIAAMAVKAASGGGGVTLAGRLSLLGVGK